MLQINWILWSIFFIQVGIVLIGVVMSGVWEGGAGRMFFDWLVGGQFLDGFTFPHSEPNWWVF